jgi:hypothetical protein
MSRLWSSLRSYWVRVIAVAAIGVFVSSYLDKTHAPLNVRYHISEFLQGLNPRGEDAQRTVLVVITDQEYWKEILQKMKVKFHNKKFYFKSLMTYP